MATPATIALITGANKGIGFETARQLGKRGIHVIIGARDAQRGADAVKKLTAEGISAASLVLEVTDETSVLAAVKEVERRHGHLDILINNAGILDYAADTGPATTTVAHFRKSFETNFFGLVSVTQAFLPLLRKSPAGRIVNLSSILGSIAEHADRNSPIYLKNFPAYDTSKAAVNLYTVELAQALADTPIKVNGVHPGWVKTEMGGEAAPMEIVDGAKSSVAAATIGPDGPTGGFFHMGVHMRW
ncbi:MAG: SDR family oxidoreductase [Planctomycetes bacterium]|nr:SDR family oxidoreductase [Planctomycetota bacterium]